jgi:hypothetical protein
MVQLAVREAHRSFGASVERQAAPSWVAELACAWTGRGPESVAWLAATVRSVLDDVGRTATPGGSRVAIDVSAQGRGFEVRIQRPDVRGAPIDTILWDLAGS